MKRKVSMMPLDIQLFADSGEESNADNNVDTSKPEDTTKTDDNKDTKKDTKSSEKKYTDEEVNGISAKNVSKALAKQLKDLGIDDIEKAKSILAKAKEDEEASKTTDEKFNEVSKKYDKARLDAINSKIENALLRKGVSESRVERAVRLIDKKNILDSSGEIDASKLSAEVEDTIKDFPELISKIEDTKKGFQVGGDGKEDKKTDELSEMRKVMGLK